MQKLQIVTGDDTIKFQIFWIQSWWINLNLLFFWRKAIVSEESKRRFKTVEVSCGDLIEIRKRRALSGCLSFLTLTNFNLKGRRLPDLFLENFSEVYLVLRESSYGQLWIPRSRLRSVQWVPVRNRIHLICLVQTQLIQKTFESGESRIESSDGVWSEPFLVN